MFVSSVSSIYKGVVFVKGECVPLFLILCRCGGFMDTSLYLFGQRSRVARSRSARPEGPGGPRSEGPWTLGSGPGGGRFAQCSLVVTVLTDTALAGSVLTACCLFFMLPP